jgi:mannose-1-phosphate guanylyltransferase
LPASTNSSIADRTWAVVLAGGVGSRFWPVSTTTRPKQILPLASPRALIADTVDRIRPLIPLDRVRILTGAPYVDPICAAVDGLDSSHFLVEPRARGTAPVLVWAAHHLLARDPDALLVSLHADHVIHPDAAFRELVATAAAAADRHDRLFTIGVRPTRPETGYGYIRRGAALDDAGAHAVEAFVEKPDADTAARYVESGDYLWNTGIFVWRAARLLEEVRTVAPELAGLLPLLDADDPGEYFGVAPVLSIDEGVLEKSGRVGVMEATFDWDDVGTWDAVARTRPSDVDGNVTEGPAELVESAGCLVWNETAEPVVVFGAEDLVVVRVRGITLVLPRKRAADLKALLGALPAEIREMEP